LVAVVFGLVIARNASAAFFLAYAQRWCTAQRPEYARDSLRDDSHGPPRFRVNAPLSNLPAFAEAFACPKDAAMARPATLRCTVW
jgi:endothelin-converting enzyme/putative endopeptidase